MKVFVVGLVVTMVCLSGFLMSASADDGMHFHCSVCGSHNHGSLWHDSDKDGVNDR